MKITAISVVFSLQCFAAVIAQDIAAPPDVASPPDDAVCTDSGLCTKVLEPGTGFKRPDAWDEVTVHYSGWTTDGRMFESSVQRGEPLTLTLSRVIPGWIEGIQLMLKGERRRLWIPVELAYNNSPGRPAGMLVFDIELLDFEDRPQPLDPPTVPEDVAGPPADAETTKSGLASKVLRPGYGTKHPKKWSEVTVHYSGWTTDGKMFDSSVVRGEPATLKLSEVIRGWTEGLQLMVVGEKRRFWIPSRLAYRGAVNAPRGMLVFDVELISFE